MSGRFVRMISSTSRNPAVVIEAYRRRLALEERVQRDGRTVQEEAQLRDLGPDLVEPREDALGDVVRAS